jgi:hypothetical protein
MWVSAVRQLRNGTALTARAKWHRGVNDGQQRMRFLAVFFGEKESPVILNPPKSPSTNRK